MLDRMDKTHGAVSIFTLQPPLATLGAGAPKIWTLIFDLPQQKVNKLSGEVLREMQSLLPELRARGERGEIDALALVSGKAGAFIAGADIEMIQEARSSSEAETLSKTGQNLLNSWEDLPFPTVAVVSGAALGGGCEFSLACSAIVMDDDAGTRIGLPEVMLGLIPGMGGCVRLPRKAGLATALDMILTGTAYSGDKALKAGLIEACLPKQNFGESALRWIATHYPQLKAGQRLAREPKLGGMGGLLGSIMEKTPAHLLIFKKARQGVLAKTKGHYPSPLEAIAVLEETNGHYGDRLRGEDRAIALAREAQGFGRVATGTVARNLIRTFYLTEHVKKSRGIADATIQPRKIERAAVLGAGIMGGGIAQLFADKRITTRMKDLSNAALTAGVQTATKIFDKGVKRKKITRRQALQKLNLIAPTTDYTGFASTQLVVEAIVENLGVKQTVCKEVEAHLEDSAVLASNTSSLSISAIAAHLKHPERFVGMHFFNPVSQMPLIEVIRGAKTSDQAVCDVFQLSKDLGKYPIVVKDAPGFLVNRLLMTYLNEAVYLLAEGMEIPLIDQVLLDFGLPMGPIELIDEVGIDVAEKVAHILFEAFGERMTPAPINNKAVATGRLGKKNGKGLYHYEGPKKTKTVDLTLYDALGITVSEPFTDEEVLDRCLLPMINEAARCLEEKVVERAEDVDLGMIMGTGFPAFRGGLLRYADTLGAKKIVERLKLYEPKFGSRFAPSDAILQRAAANRSFY